MTIFKTNDAAAAARIAELEAALVIASAPRKLTLKVGEKGGVSVYGLNKQFPVTLYAQQWDRLIEFIPQVKAFISANTDKLAVKPVKA